MSFNFDFDRPKKIHSLEVEMLGELVGINSQVGNVTGILQAQKYMEAKLRDLGFKVHLIENPMEASAPLLVARKQGQVNANITLIGHTDTVNSPESHPFRLNFNSNRIYGAGVGDDKGGLVVGLSALRRFFEDHPRHKNSIQFIVSPTEETGSVGFHSHFKRIGDDSEILLGLEPADVSGNVFCSRSGNRWYKITVKGRKAHSGRFGESHINAAHELSRIINDLSHLSDESLLTRVNVGAVTTSTHGFNTICGEAEANVDFRFADLLTRDRIHQLITHIIGNIREACPYTGDKALTEFTIEDDCPAMPAQGKDRFLQDSILKSIHFYENRTCEAKHSGGAADINYFTNDYNMAVDGLGPIAKGMHTNSEFILADSLISRTKVLTATLSKLETSYETQYRS